jgi:hypothetical protein
MQTVGPDTTLDETPAYDTAEHDQRALGIAARAGFGRDVACSEGVQAVYRPCSGVSDSVALFVFVDISPRRG